MNTIRTPRCTWLYGTAYMIFYLGFTIIHIVMSVFMMYVYLEVNFMCKTLDC